MARYRKLIAALVGLVVIVGRDWAGFDLDAGMVDKMVDVIMIFMTLAGVWGATNEI
jgi:hypothetical protein